MTIFRVTIDDSNRVTYGSENGAEDTEHTRMVAEYLSPVLVKALPDLVKRHGKVKPEHLEPILRALEPVISAAGFTKVEIQRDAVTVSPQDFTDQAAQLRALADLLDKP